MLGYQVPYTEFTMLISRLFATAASAIWTIIWPAVRVYLDPALAIDLISYLQSLPTMN